MQYINDATLIKGLVIFNPAVGGWSTGEGGQNFLKTCLREDEKILGLKILFELIQNCTFLLRRSKYFHFSR